MMRRNKRQGDDRAGGYEPIDRSVYYHYGDKAKWESEAEYTDNQEEYEASAKSAAEDDEEDFETRMVAEHHVTQPFAQKHTRRSRRKAAARSKKAFRVKQFKKRVAMYCLSEEVDIDALYARIIENQRHVGRRMWKMRIFDSDDVLYKRCTYYMDQSPPSFLLDLPHNIAAKRRSMLSSPSLLPVSASFPVKPKLKVDPVQASGASLDESSETDKSRSSDNSKYSFSSVLNRHRVSSTDTETWTYRRAKVNDNDDGDHAIAEDEEEIRMNLARPFALDKGSRAKVGDESPNVDAKKKKKKDDADDDDTHWAASDNEDIGSFEQSRVVSQPPGRNINIKIQPEPVHERRSHSNSDDFTSEMPTISRSSKHLERDTTFDDIQDDDIVSELKFGKDVFVFSYGCIVFWGFSESEEMQYLEEVRSGGFLQEDVSPKEFEFSADDLMFVIRDSHTGAIKSKLDASGFVSVENDLVTIDGAFDIEEKLALSFAFAQSCKLFVYEERVNQKIDAYKHIPNALAERGEIPLSQTAIAKMAGDLFKQRNEVNLHSDILDTPDFFWHSDNRHEVKYRELRQYLDIPNRILVLNNRLNVIKEFLDMLQHQLDNTHASKLEWIVIWLILVEVLVEVIGILYAGTPGAL